MNEIYPQEVIKEYLTYNSLTTTLECFQAELKSKSLAPSKPKKKKDSSLKLPTLYTYCMGEEAKSSVHQSLEKRLAQLQKSYDQLKTSSTKIFEIAVTSVTLLEEAKLAEDQVSSFKLLLSKLQHDLGVKSIKSKEAAILNPSYIQNIRNQLIHLLESKNFKSLTQLLIKTRLECLSVKQKSRAQLIEALAQSDIFAGSINLLMTSKSYPVICAAMALVSIVCSADVGKRYVIGNNPGYICTLVINILRREEHNSVCARFCIAVLEKLSLHDGAAGAMVDNNFAEYVVEHLVKADSHPFVLNFGTALLFNLLSVPAGRAHISSSHEQYNKTLHKLCTFCKDSSQDLDVTYHCLLSINRILKIYPNLMVAKDINRIVDVVKESQDKDEETKAKIFELCGKLLNRNVNKEEKMKKNKEKTQSLQEFYYFECFTDEAPLIHD